MIPLVIVPISILLTVAVCWLVIALPLSKRLDALARDSEAMRQALRRAECHEEANGGATVAPRSAGRLAAARPRARPVDAGVSKPSTPRSAAGSTDAPAMTASAQPERRAPARLERASAARDRVARYRDLLAQRPKPRQLQDVIDEDVDARAIGFGPDGATLLLSTFDPDDPGQMLVALSGPDEEGLVVLPTFEYLESFRVAFSAPMQNPAIVRHLFVLDQDDAGGLRLIEPALLRFDEVGTPHKSRAGRMGGYSSGI